MTWYRTGTVSVTNGSAIVTGAGTAFVANVIAGQALATFGGVTPIEILAVNADNQITLAQPWPGNTAGGLAFAIVPTDGPTFDLFNRVSQLLNTFAAVRDNAGAGLFGAGSKAAPGVRALTDQDTGLAWLVADALSLIAGGQEAARIAAGLARFFGTVQAGPNDAGTAFAAVGRASDELAAYRLFNPDGSATRGSLAWQGGIVQLQSVSHASIMAAAGSGVLLSVGGVDQVQAFAGQLVPGGDNTINLGAPAKRWTTVYAASGAINTSDEREKQWRGVLTADELAAAREIAATIGVFQFNDAIAEKGDAARLHVGVKAQQVVAIMTAHGLDPMRYGFVCHDAWPATPARPAVDEERDEDGRVVVMARDAVPARPAGERFGIRYDELAMFVAAAQEQRLAALEAKLDA